MTITLEPARREQVRLRLALIGATGSGKTRGALDIATAVAAADGGKIAGFDTEHGRMKLFADRYKFDHANLADRSPEGYVEAINVAAAGGHSVAILDSGSHEWLSVLLEADRFSNWKDLSPRHAEFIEAIAAAPIHLIVTFRAKMRYDVAEVEEGGRKRQIITKLGVGPVARENTEYEFDIIGYLDESHEAQWTNRCDPLVGTVSKPADAAPVIVEWLAHGDPIEEAEPAAIEELRKLLADAGFSEERIEGGFATARADNSGVLHPDYVVEQTAKVRARLEAKSAQEAAKKKPDAAAEEAA